MVTRLGGVWGSHFTPTTSGFALDQTATSHIQIVTINPKGALRGFSVSSYKLIATSQLYVQGVRSVPTKIHLASVPICGIR